jgi:anti-sigma B factor antagonist
MTVEHGADAFRDAVRQLIRQGRVKLVVNFQAAPYIDSTALGEIVRLHTSVTRRVGGLRLLHVTPHVKDLLVVTKLLPAFDLRDDEAEAIKSFSIAQLP